MSRTRATRWATDLPWPVPRNLQCQPPSGMRWAAPGRCLILGPTKPPQTIRPEDWGDALATEIQAVMLVSAVYARAQCIGRWPTSHVLFTRRPTVARVSVGGHITVSAAGGHTGELWAFPLACTDAHSPATVNHEPSHHP